MTNKDAEVLGTTLTSLAVSKGWKTFVNALFAGVYKADAVLGAFITKKETKKNEIHKKGNEVGIKVHFCLSYLVKVTLSL